MNPLRCPKCKSIDIVPILWMDKDSRKCQQCDHVFWVTVGVRIGENMPADFLFPELEMAKGAKFSECRTWRYSLWRKWDPELPRLVVIGLNPSTADETNDDPTIRRCINFARTWGCGSYYMLNLFAYRSTDPAKMRMFIDPVGPDNDETIMRVCRLGDIVLAAWGHHGVFRGRGLAVMEMLKDVPVFCLGKTKDGFPAHPLYQPANAQRILYAIGE